MVVLQDEPSLTADAYQAGGAVILQECRIPSAHAISDWKYRTGCGQTTAMSRYSPKGATETGIISLGACQPRGRVSGGRSHVPV